MKTTFPDLASLVSDFVESHGSIWRGIDPTFFEIGNEFDDQQKIAGAELSTQLLSDLEEHLMHFPRSAAQQSKWRDAAFGMLRRFMESCLQYSPDEQELLFGQPYQQVTCDFVEQAQAFDQTIDMDDLFQALRNVWIMNSVQVLLDQQVGLTRSVFAYSMLYPCTDNFLDDDARTVYEKHEFNDWVEDRINGVAANRVHPHLDLLFNLIELDHPRPVLPQVYDSVMAIQRAQRQAMIQQSGRLDQAEVLRLSIAKGGTSVMAHGYLVNGHIDRDQAEFLFGFGVFLQLLDDLQDVREDLKAKHWTLFSSAAVNDQCIDEIVLRLLHFMGVVLARMDRFSSGKSTVLCKTIWRNCVLLLLTAVAHHEKFCSRRLVERLEPFSPFYFHTIRGLSKMLGMRYGRVRQKLVDGKKVRSVWNVLGPASGDLWSLPTEMYRTVDRTCPWEAGPI